MTSTGENLRAERERRGLSLDDLTDTTKIQKRHLQAIERGDWDELPGDVFAKGYVRSYAEALGLDSERIADAYTRERQAAEADAAPRRDRRTPGSARAALARLAELGPPAGDRSRTRLLLLAAALVVTLVTIGAFVLWPDGDGDDDRGGTIAPPVATGTRAPAPEAAVPDEATDEATDAAQAAATGRATTETPPPVEPAAPEPAAPEPAAPEPAADRPVAAAKPAPPSKPAARPAQPTGLDVTEFGVGTGVRGLDLVGETDLFREGQEVSFWTRVVGGSRGDAIRHVWIHEGRQVASIRLRIGGSHWRTHSAKQLTAGSAGDWAVEARDRQGRVLARSTFSCLPARAS